VTKDLTLAVLVQRMMGALFKDDAEGATLEALIETHEPTGVT